MVNAAQDDAFRSSNPGSPDFLVERYPFYLLNRLVSLYNGIIETQLRTIGLDIPSWRVLMILGERDQRGTREIAEAAVINLSTMTRIIQRMTAANLVSARHSKKDGRVTIVTLTTAGQARLAGARRISAPIYEQLVKDVASDELGRFIDLLDRLHTNLAPLAKG